MRSPDYISPIIGYRVWQWDAAGLKSLNGEHWMPHNPLSATCRASSTLVRRGESSRHAHDAPAADCTCGIYAAQTADHLRRSGYDQYGIHGEVYLWGTVVEHQIGWRAEFAYPKALHLPKEMLPITLKQIQSRIEALVGYGCDICIAYDASKIPLWRKESGFDGAGLDFLTSRSIEWYAQRKNERTIKTGSRVAILGRGIAVVQRVGAEQVHAVLWNRSAIKIDRRRIGWDEQNMRWEANGHSTTSR